MTPEAIRLLAGLVVMAAACGIAYRIGDRPVRLTAGLIAASWIIAFAGQRLTGMLVEPLLASELVAGIGLLFLAASFSADWLWAEVGIEVLLLCMHAWFYGNDEATTRGEIIANNVLASTSLLVLVGAAARSRRVLADDGEG